MPRLTGNFCKVCGDSIDARDILQNYGCRRCRLAPPAFERAISYGHYDGRLRAAIHAFKYDGMRALSRRLGQMLASSIAQIAETLPENMMVIPVPLHRGKRAVRGYNQALLLAEAALHALHHSTRGNFEMAPKALLRQKATESQSELTPHQRRANMRGAFSILDSARVSGRHILLVDDILTTGATARAASVALLRSGAESVTVATLARALRPFEPVQSFTHSSAGQQATPGTVLGTIDHLQAGRG